MAEPVIQKFQTSKEPITAKNPEPQPEVEDVVHIENKMTRAFGVAGPHDPKVKGVQVGVLFTLVPGINKVPRSAWAIALQQKMVQVHIDEDHFVEVENKSIAKLKEREAVVMVKKALKRDVLDMYRSQDRRPAVVKAINEQLRILSETRPAEQQDSLLE